jgi:hypothetical protein
VRAFVVNCDCGGDGCGRGIARGVEGDGGGLRWAKEESRRGRRHGLEQKEKGVGLLVGTPPGCCLEHTGML